MFRITDKRGYDYYMTVANLPEYYQGYDNEIVGATKFIKQAQEEDLWVRAYRDSLLRDGVWILGSEIYIVEEVR